MKAGDIPATTFGKTGVQVSVIAQGVHTGPTMEHWKKQA
jgi:hypothetical protein